MERSPERPALIAVTRENRHCTSHVEWFPRRGTVFVSAALMLVCACIAAMALGRDRLLINTSQSVPPGLYVRADPSAAGFVTFCLPELPAWVKHDRSLCGVDNPPGTPVIKRIIAEVDQGVILRGGGTFALDSRVFGPLPRDRIVGFWRLVVTPSFCREKTFETRMETLCRIREKSPVISAIADFLRGSTCVSARSWQQRKPPKKALPRR